METTFFRSLPKKLFFPSLCSSICLQAVYQLSGLCARLLGMAAFVFCFLPSFHAFVIDFLSIRKVIIFSAIATDDRHPPTVTFYTPKCCKLHDDSFLLYCTTEGGTENLLRTFT